MASPVVSVACSLAAISCITILTKEGVHFVNIIHSFHNPQRYYSIIGVCYAHSETGHVQNGEFSIAKISQVTLMIFMAITASSLVSFTLWPSSACAELRYILYPLAFLPFLR